MNILFGKINHYLFFFGETINIAIIVYFSGVLNIGFCLLYSLVLLVLMIIKNYCFFSKYAVLKRLSILPVSMVLMEFSITFLTYTGISIRSEIVVTILGFTVLYFMLFKSNEFLRKLYFKLIVLAYLCVLLSLITFNKTLIIEFVKVFFVITSILLLKKYNNEIYLLIPLMISSVVLVIFAQEYGTIMILGITFLGMCLFSNNRRIMLLPLITIVIIFVVWIYFYKIKGAYLWVYGSVDSSKQSLQRLFFDYKDNDQIIMLRSIVANRNWLDKVSTIIAPPKYVEIVSYENTHSTSSADYFYSVMMYSFGQVYSFIIIAVNISLLFHSIAKHVNHQIRIIPILLLSQSMVHVLGNCLLFPFTGITYPFLSHGGSSLLCNVILLCILSYCEINEMGE